MNGTTKCEQRPNQQDSWANEVRNLQRNCNPTSNNNRHVNHSNTLHYNIIMCISRISSFVEQFSNLEKSRQKLTSEADWQTTLDPKSNFSRVSHVIQMGPMGFHGVNKEVCINKQCPNRQESSASELRNLHRNANQTSMMCISRISSSVDHKN